MKKLLIAGMSSFVGSNLALRLRRDYRISGTYSRHHPRIDGVSAFHLPLTPETPVGTFLKLIRPDAVVYCVAENDNLKCEKDPKLARLLNVTMPQAFASALTGWNGRFIFLSTSKVFSGDEGNYTESDNPYPQTAYGQTKKEAESVLSSYPNAVCLRLGTVYGLGAWHQHSALVNRYLFALMIQKEIPLIMDEYRSFLWVDDLVEAVGCIIDALEPPGNLFHVAGTERHSYFSFGKTLASAFGFSTQRLKGVTGAEFKRGGEFESRGADLTLNGELIRQAFGVEYHTVAQSLTKLKKVLEKGQQ